MFVESTILIDASSTIRADPQVIGWVGPELSPASISELITQLRSFVATPGRSITLVGTAPRILRIVAPQSDPKRMELRLRTMIDGILQIPRTDHPYRVFLMIDQETLIEPFWSRVSPVISELLLTDSIELVLLFGFLEGDLMLNDRIRIETHPESLELQMIQDRSQGTLGEQTNCLHLTLLRSFDLPLVLRMIMTEKLNDHTPDWIFDLEPIFVREIEEQYLADPKPHTRYGVILKDLGRASLALTDEPKLSPDSRAFRLAVSIQSLLSVVLHDLSIDHRFPMVLLRDPGDHPVEFSDHSVEGQISALEQAFQLEYFREHRTLHSLWLDSDEPEEIRLILERLSKGGIGALILRSRSRQ